MKAEDLMIGDWVRFDMSISYENPQGSGMWVVCQVESVSRPIFEGRTRNLFLKADNFYGGYERILEEIEPIPLTPEILEKNGFKFCEDDNCSLPQYRWHKEGKRDGFSIEIIFYNPPISGVKVLTKINTECSHDCGVNSVHNCDIEYVHELQHALKLCGIEKEIILKKKCRHNE